MLTRVVHRILVRMGLLRKSDYQIGFEAGLAVATVLFRESPVQRHLREQRGQPASPASLRSEGSAGRSDAGKSVAP